MPYSCDTRNFKIQVLSLLTLRGTQNKIARCSFPVYLYLFQSLLSTMSQEMNHLSCCNTQEFLLNKSCIFLDKIYYE